MRAQMRPDSSVYAALLIFADRQGMPEYALDVWEALQEVCVHLQHTKMQYACDNIIPFQVSAFPCFYLSADIV